MPMFLRTCAPGTQPLVLPHTYMYMKIFCTLSHAESSAPDFSLSSVSPHTVEHVLVFDDGTAGVVTIFIVLIIVLMVLCTIHFLSKSIPPARFITL